MARVDPDLKPVPVRSADGPKASERAQGLQETFLNHVRTNAVPLTVFLLNGVKLQGVVTAFDNFSLLLQRGADSTTGLQARDLNHHADRPDPAL